MKIIAVLPNSPLLGEVKALWRINSDTLGNMPEGGFDDYASKRRIMGLVDGTRLQAYLMYRVSRNMVKITHLCVAEYARGKGVARLLVDELIRITQHCNGIELRCRRDFAASGLWPKLRFASIGERQGRAAAGSILTVWSLDYGKPTLLTQPSQARTTEAVIDANILIDIIDARSLESMALCADWLQDELQLCVTDEVFNDLNRQPDDAMRARRFVDAEGFRRLTHSPSDYDEAEALLTPVFPQGKSPRSQSDFRHLVRAVAAGVKIFISRDEELLRNAETVYIATGLSIVRPSEIVTRIDELAREQEYQRTLVAGTKQISRQRVSELTDELMNAIVYPNESRRNLTNQIRQFLSDPLRFACERITNIDGSTLALYVIDTEAALRDIHVFRVAANRLSGTLSRAILTSLLRDAVSAKRMGVSISDPLLNEVQNQACVDLGFRRSNERLIKLTISGIRDRNELAEHIRSFQMPDPLVAQISENLGESLTPEDESELEHILWPAKIGSSEQHNFIVPIRPDFAEQLFDEGLAKQTLWGADIDLALNSESVYYRSARQRIVKFPGRILWYISDKGKLDGRKAIRACSRITEVAVDKPKNLFRRFQRLGVYEWSDVFETARRDLETDVMAIRFHDTELLNPVKWDSFQSVLQSCNILTNLESPVSITSQAFEEIYALAFNTP